MSRENCALVQGVAARSDTSKWYKVGFDFDGDQLNMTVRTSLIYDPHVGMLLDGLQLGTIFINHCDAQYCQTTIHMRDDEKSKILAAKILELTLSVDENSGLSLPLRLDHLGEGLARLKEITQFSNP